MSNCSDNLERRGREITAVGSEVRLPRRPENSVPWFQGSDAMQACCGQMGSHRFGCLVPCFQVTAAEADSRQKPLLAFGDRCGRLLGDLGRAPLTVPRVGHVAASCLRGLHSEQVTKPCCPDASGISAHLNGPEPERHPSRLEGLLVNETAPCWGSPAFAVTLCSISSLSKHAQHRAFHTLVLAVFANPKCLRRIHRRALRFCP